MKGSAAMTDNPTTSRRPRKAKEAKPKDSRWTNAPAWKQKYGDASRWSGEFASVEENRFSLPQEVVDGLARDGIALQWHTESVLGQVQDSLLSVAQKNGWQFVGENEIPGVHTVAHGGQRLMARPMAIHEKAERRDKADAIGAITRMKQKHGEGDLPGVSPEAARHPSARKAFKHNRTFERIDIPDSD
jgi:hypothetical protein